MADADFIIALRRILRFRAFRKLLYDYLASVDGFADQHTNDDSVSLRMLLIDRWLVR